jgi:hypothetical protein
MAPLLTWLASWCSSSPGKYERFGHLALDFRPLSLLERGMYVLDTVCPRCGCSMSGRYQTRERPSSQDCLVAKVSLSLSLSLFLPYPPPRNCCCLLSRRPSRPPATSSLDDSICLIASRPGPPTLLTAQGVACAERP